jgi:hypothetical protein
MPPLFDADFRFSLLSILRLMPLLLIVFSFHAFTPFSPPAAAITPCYFTPFSSPIIFAAAFEDFATPRRCRLACIFRLPPASIYRSIAFRAVFAAAFR